MSIATLLKRALPGAKSSIAGHIERGERIAQAIQQRFDISKPRQWQAKHLRWVLERWAGEMSDATRYDYWRIGDGDILMGQLRQNARAAFQGPQCGDETQRVVSVIMPLDDSGKRLSEGLL